MGIRGLVAWGALAMALGVSGCGGGAEATGGDDGTGEDALTAACTSRGQCPTTFGQLRGLTSAQLGEVFDKGTIGNHVYSGVFSGLPLCFPDQLPPDSAFPQGALDVPGFTALLGAMRLLGNDQMNNLASFLWHGKRFTPRTNATISTLLTTSTQSFIPIADVKNNIGRTDVDFSGEAILLVDRAHRSIDLDYHVATTGLQIPGGVDIPGISSISVDVIRHIWDRVRLVNAKQRLYLGEAYIVGQPGRYDGSAVPICYFALTPEGSPAAALDR